VSGFNANSLAILGRQPALGIAELEALCGANSLKPLDNCVLLQPNAFDINFARLGGTIKLARILTRLPSQKWADIMKYLLENIPQAQKINSDLLDIKKRLKRISGRSIRIVPNSTEVLSSAQVLHNKLTTKGAWELILVKDGQHSVLAQTVFVQDINAYAARDQKRPKRDSSVGMLPPKLAQIIVNLATGHIFQQESLEPANSVRRTVRVLDPFCGTGVILQEALLMGYHVLGTDLKARMIEYSKTNLQWLFEQYPKLEGQVALEVADAATYRWPRFSVIASEAYLGAHLNRLPPQSRLNNIIHEVNDLITKFLKNIHAQLRPGQVIVLAVPEWAIEKKPAIRLPIIDKITDIGYNYFDFEHVGRNDLVYYRADQIVGRRLIRLKKN
jgi:tRNA G10  N-methylase Trm11